MKRYKKVLTILLAGAMVVSSAACAKSDKGTDTEPKKSESGDVVKATDTDAKSKDNDLVIAIEGTVTSMDPHNIPDTNAISATRGVYENLVKFDKDNQVVGQLAKSWEISDDSLTYTFHLNEGIKFHDGTDFNAAAVKANYDRVINKDNNLRTRRTYIVTNADGTEKPRVESIETPDDYTVVYKLTEAWSPFINRLTQFCIISPAALEKHGNDIMYNACGTGPYTIKEWKAGDQTSMVRNEDYWGENKPTVDTVTIKEVPEAGSRTAMLQTGEADMIYPMPADQLSAVEGTGDVNIKTTESNIMRYVTLNMNLPELKEVKVRQAMNYAIDKEAYVKLMYAGYGVPATSVVPSIIGGYKEQKAYEYDVEKAKSLLKEAGYEDGFELTLWGDNSTQEIKGMTFIKQQLEQVGITVEVLPMDPATVNDKINVPLDQSEVNMWYVNWSASDFTMDGSLRSLLYSTMAPPVSANTVYYNNAKFDAALDDGLKTADLDEQAKVYEEAQKMAWDDATWLFLGNDQIIYADKSYLSNVYVGPDGAFNYAEASLAQ